MTLSLVDSRLGESRFRRYCFQCEASGCESTEDQLESLHSHWTAVSFKNVVDPFRLAMLPTVDFPLVGGFEESMRMQFVKLIDVLRFSYYMLVPLFTCRSIKIAHDQFPSESEMSTGVHEPFERAEFIVEAMVHPIHVHIGNVEQTEIRNVHRRHCNVAGRIIVFAMVSRDVSRI